MKFAHQGESGLAPCTGLRSILCYELPKRGGELWGVEAGKVVVEDERPWGRRIPPPAGGEGGEEVTYNWPHLNYRSICAAPHHTLCILSLLLTAYAL